MMYRRGLVARQQARLALQQLHVRPTTELQRHITQMLSTLTTDAARTERDHDRSLAETDYTHNAPACWHHRRIIQADPVTPATPATRPPYEPDCPSNQLIKLETVPSFGQLAEQRVEPGRRRISDGNGGWLYEFKVEVPSLANNGIKLMPHVLFLKSLAELDSVIKVAWKRGQQAWANWSYVKQTALGPDLNEIARNFWFWKFEFNKLSLGLEPVCENEKLARSLYQLDSVAEMKKRWAQISEIERQRLWPEVMLSTLWNSLENADMMLEATLNHQNSYATTESVTAGYVAADTLGYFVQRIQLDEIRDRLARKRTEDRVLGLITGMLENANKNGVEIRQWLLGKIAKRLPPSHTASLYDVLTQVDYHLHTYTLLHFASKLGQAAEHKTKAFQILQILVERDNIFSEESFKADVTSSVITTLLNSTKDQMEGTATDFDPGEALQYFMEAGYQPNIVSLTSYLGTLSKTGQDKEALQLALLFEEEGVVLDLKGWQTILRAAKATWKYDQITKAIDVGRDMNIPVINILSSALHAIYQFAAREMRVKELQRPWSLPLFRHMLRIYAMRFDLTPLQWWIPDSLPLLLMEGMTAEGDKFKDHTNRMWDFPETVVPLAEEIFNEGPEKTNLMPSTKVIASMLRAYIRSLHQPYDLMTFYSFFKSKVEARDERGIAFFESEGTIVHDTFILCLMEHDGLARAALQVFGDMLRGSLSGGEVRALESGIEKNIPANGQDGSSSSNDGQAEAVLPCHPQPSVFTYNITLRGLASQCEDAMATQVYQVMNENNVGVTRTTMNTMIKAYARSQKTRHTVQALQDLELQGFKPDHYTYTAFGKLRNQKEAIELMEMIIETNRKKEELNEVQQSMY